MNYEKLSDNISEQIKKDRRNDNLSAFGFNEENALRRDNERDKATAIRTAFIRDTDKIIHCPYFNRYADKTQVFSFYKNDDITHRILHVQLVSRIARTIGKALCLNLDLIEAIALGHDIGHTPFGHAGEFVLNGLCENGFRHNEQSVRIVEKLEKDGKGLNLTWEVRDGILNHQSRLMPHTLEGKIVRFSDKIAYINHDIDDAVRAGIIRENDIPQHLRKRLGETHGKRIDTLVTAMIEYGQRYLEIGMDEQMHADMMELRQFMFDHVYHGTAAQREEKRAKSMLRSLYEYFIEHPDELPDDYFVLQARGEALERIACDYVAGMTDRYSIAVYKNLFIPKSWNKIED